MKLLIVANMYPSADDPSFGTFIKVFEDGLRKYDDTYDVSHVVIAGRATGKLKKLFKYIVFYLELIFRLAICKYDIVYVHTITFPIPPIWLVSKFRRLNLIFNVHGVDVLTRSTIADTLKQMSRPLLQSCRYVVVPSKYYAEVVLRELPEVASDKIIVSPSGGVEPSFYSFSCSPRRSIPKIGFVSRITQKKGWDKYLRALAILRDKGVSFEASIVGAGDQKATMLDMIESLSLADCVKYLGAKGHNDLPEYYKSLDFFVFPSESKSESLGLVGIEAMASSVPVIGSDIEGISTYLIHGVNGLQFSVGRAEALSDAIESGIKMPDAEYSQLRRNAYATAEKYRTDIVLSELFLKIFTNETS